MLGVKKFFFYVFGLALIALAVFALSQIHKGPDAAIGAGVIALVPLIIMLLIRHSTKCPKCKKVWVGKKLSDEDMGVSSNTYTKKTGNDYHTYEKHRYLLSYRCISCGHEWQKTVERERQLD